MAEQQDHFQESKEEAGTASPSDILSPPPPVTDWEKVDADIGRFGMWVNNRIVGNPITFMLAILSVIGVYGAIPLVGGYSKWNTGLGLFYNTLSSSFELITGVGAVVGVVALHAVLKRHRAHSEQHLASLHSKLDKLVAELSKNPTSASPTTPAGPTPTSPAET